MHLPTYISKFCFINFIDAFQLMGLLLVAGWFAVLFLVQAPAVSRVCGP